MSRLVLYMAHPLGGDVIGNINLAKRWLTWLRRSFPETTFIAPWIAAILAGEDDADPVQREAGLVDACATIKLLGGVVWVGGAVTDGMGREGESAIMIFDLTFLGILPPRFPTPPGGFLAYVRNTEAPVLHNPYDPSKASST